MFDDGFFIHEDVFSPAECDYLNIEYSESLVIEPGVTLAVA